MPDSIDARVVALIAKKKRLPPERLTSDTKLRDLGIDSLDAMDLVFDFEDEFKIAIPDEAVQQMATVGDVIDAITRACGERAAPAG